MTEPANIPLERICQDEERKHESTVFQFHSIETGIRAGRATWGPAHSCRRAWSCPSRHCRGPFRSCPW